MPKFHLKRFANERGMLTRIALPGENRHLISINDATVEKDFYLVRGEDGEQHDDVEKFLSDAEAEAAPAIRRIVDDGVWPIDEDTRMAVAIWSALQLLRTTVQRQQRDELTDALFKLQVGAGGRPQMRAVLRDQNGCEPTDDEVDSMWATLTDFDSYGIGQNRNSHVTGILGELPETTGLLLARGWHLFYFRRKALVTCDNPVTLVPSTDHPRWRSIGSATAGMILVPLDRHVMLAMVELGGADDRPPVSTMVAKAFNGAVALNAHKAVFYHPSDDPLAGIALPPPRERFTNAGEGMADLIFPDGVRA